MKQRMRLSPKNKVKLSIRFRLLAFISVFVLAVLGYGLYLFFIRSGETVANKEIHYFERFGFYRTISASAFIPFEGEELHHVPISVILEHGDFKSQNYGGRLFDASARDLVFVKKGERNPLKSQIESYDAARGLIHATIWIDSLKQNEKPEFDVYYSGPGSYSIPFIETSKSLLISMNDGISGNYGVERISAMANGTFKTIGLLGNARGFSNERGDYLQYNLGNRAVFQQGFTLSLWIYPELKNQHQTLCGLNDLAGNAIRIELNNKNSLCIKLVHSGEETILLSQESKLPPNQWAQLSFSCDTRQKTVQLFLNGKEILNENSSFSMGIPVALYFGRSSQNASDGYTGSIDQVELIPEFLAADWNRFAYTFSAKPIADWNYGMANSTASSMKRVEHVRSELTKQGKSQATESSARYTLQKNLDNSYEAPLTVSSSAVIMQQKMQSLQQRAKNRDLSAN
jgi:hypothetical protein